MVTKLPPELLDRQPEEVSRVLALSLLEEAATALERMGNSEDGEALHDFRVGLRRLRSAIRAYRPYLKDSVPKKARKELRSLAASTNAARDTEVQLAWIRAQGARLNETEAAGLRWLVERLEINGEVNREEQLRSLSQDFNRIRTVLTKGLSFWKVRLDVADQDKNPSFRKLTGAILREQLATLITQLDAIHGPEDDPQAHSARICAKRLRYLLEPLIRAVPGTKAFVKQFKGLQDLLGDLHDTNLMVVEIGAAMEASAIQRARRLHELAFPQGDTVEFGPDKSAKPDRPDRDDNPLTPAGPDENPGLLALATLLKERRQELFTQFKTEWQGPRLEKLRVKLEELGAKMSSFGEDRLAVRRYILNRVPDGLKRYPSTFIQEGWLPGANIEEFLRRVRTSEAVRYFRIIPKDAETSGPAQEETISRRIFESFWPLTAKRRIRKRRYEVLDGSRMWRIDVFVGIELVLAEIDVLPNERAEGELPLPDWLARCVQKKVTGDKKYLRPYAIPKKGVRRRRKGPTRVSSRASSSPTRATRATRATRGRQARVLEEKIPSNGRERSLRSQTSPDVRAEKQ
ncbi:MAG: CHAD domain-containing protein [Vicinamibacteria bacterium]